MHCYVYKKPTIFQGLVAYLCPAVPALNLTTRQVSELNACWNNVIRRLFGYHKWESSGSGRIGSGYAFPGRVGSQNLDRVWESVIAVLLWLVMSAILSCCVQVTFYDFIDICYTVHGDVLCHNLFLTVLFDKNYDDE